MICDFTPQSAWKTDTSGRWLEMGPRATALDFQSGFRIKRSVCLNVCVSARACVCVFMSKARR